MKTIKNKTFQLVIALVLVLSLSMGMTFAYFSDRTEAKGGATLTLGGKTEIEETVTDKSKEVGIKNIGETDVLVRVGIYGPSTMTEITYSGNDWEKIGDFYYYKHILPAGESAKSNITATIAGPEGVVQNFDVVVVNECVQVTYDDNVIDYPDGWPDNFLS
jgi:predicted ribosomally synthesized peptide with SipW-like signal peptide